MDAGELRRRRERQRLAMAQLQPPALPQPRLPVYPLAANDDEIQALRAQAMAARRLAP